jgi:hypothetical protein
MSMPNTLESKLVKLGVEPDVAEKLVKAGLETPKKIKEATDKAMKDAGVTDAKIIDLRKRYSKEK